MEALLEKEEENESKQVTITTAIEAFQLKYNLVALKERRDEWRLQRDNMKTRESTLTTDSLYRDSEEWYIHYILKAHLLKDSTEVVTLVKEIQQHYKRIGGQSDSMSLPFFAVSAPSGSGKTQLAFTLGEYSQLDVLHICMTDAQESEQEIYKHDTISVMSKLLRVAVRQDFQNFYNLEDCTTSRLLEKDAPVLCTVALLSAALGIKTTNNSLITSVCELRAAVRTIADTGIYPVVVVDEAFQHMSGLYTNTLNIQLDLHIEIFLRSVLRATGIASIFMGATVNMVQCTMHAVRGPTCSHSIRSWAGFIALVPLLPTVTVHDGMRAVFPSWIDSTDPFRGVNPRLMQQLCDAVIGRGMALQSALAHVARLTYLTKDMLRTTDGVRAQVLYMLNNTRPELRAPAVVSMHFARFNKDEEVMVQATETCVVTTTPPGGTQTWQPVPDFPSCSEDPLLPLVLGGPCDSALHPAPFVLKYEGERFDLTSAAAFLLSQNHDVFSNRAHSIPMRTERSKYREGDVMESITALATVNASRAGGLQGINAADYLLAMIREMLAFGAPLLWRDETLWDCWSSANTTTIPYIPRVDDEYPHQLLPSVGRLTRTLKIDRMDLSLTLHDKMIVFKECMMSVSNKPSAPATENKTTKGSSGAGGSIIRNVLQRFNTNGSDANLGVVIISHLANLNRDSNVDAKDLENTCIVHITVGTDNQVDVRRIISNITDSATQHSVTLPKPRMLCFIEYDVERIMKQLSTEPVLAEVFRLA